ncbi:MAG TPA: hypothetical protein VFP72_08630 [Kineosporiaceae bacterium]|nr:hypothetical protein [Kineosporiaceae bacterium]
MPVLTLPGMLRAALATHRTPPPDPTPARPPVRVPAPRRPADVACPTASALAPIDPDPVPSAGPQAQGDVIVLPWPDFMSPHVRFLHTASAAPVGRAGLVLLDPHTLIAEHGGVFWSWWPDTGPTLGTLVVPAGTVARLGHDTHRDLRIAPGVYALRRQRREVSGRIEMAVD